MIQASDSFADFQADMATDPPVTPPTPAPPVDPPTPDPFADFKASMDAVPTPAASSPSDARASALRASLQATSAGSPDAAAKADAVSQRTGVPPDVAARNPQEAEAVARQQDAAARAPVLLAHHPTLAQWLSDPDNARVSHDDVPNLQHLDFATRLLAAQAQPVGPEPLVPQAQDEREPLPWWSGVVGRGARQGLANIGQQVTAEAATVQHVYRWLSGADEPANYTPPAAWTPLGALYNSTDLIAHEQQAYQSYRSSVAKDVGTSISGMASDPSNILLPLTGAELAAKAAPAVATATQRAARALTGAVATQATQAGTGSLQGTLAAKQRVNVSGGPITPGLTDIGAAAAQAAFAALTGRAAGLVGPWAQFRGTPLTWGEVPRDILTNTTVGGVQAAGSQVIQSATTGTPAPEPGDIARAYLSGAIPGLLLSGLNIPGARAYSRAQGLVQEMVRAQQAQENARVIAAAGVAAQNAKTTARAPERLQQLMSQVAQATGAPDAGRVLFQTSDWDSHWWEGDPADPKGGQLAQDMVHALTGDPNAYALAKATGAPISIPAEAYTARLAATTHFEPLLEHARLQPDGMSLGEANRFLQATPDAMAKLGQAVKDELADVKVDESGEKVKQQIIEQLVQAGHAPEAAETAAQIHRNFWETMAGHFSPEGAVPVHADELATQFPLSISNEAPPEAAPLTPEGPAPKEPVASPSARALGSIRLRGPAADIRFTPRSNLTTFLHESGHHFLNVMEHLAGRGDAPATLVAHVNAIKEWLGVKPGEAISDAQHEQFAEALESYYTKGEAPTVALRPIFQRFKAWMQLVYGKERALHAHLSPEVHDLFDRTFAAQHEIAAARERAGDTRTLPREYFPSDEAHAAYEKTVAASAERAESDLRASLANDFAREYSKQYRDERSAIRDKIAPTVDARPVYTALKALQDGEWPAHVAEEWRQYKLSAEDIRARYDGQAGLDALPGPRLRDAEGKLVDRPNAGRRIYSEKGGFPLEDAAQLFGFRSGDEFYHALVNAEDRDAVVDREADTAMRDLYPDPLRDGSVAQAADDALGNEAKGALLVQEVRALASKAGGTPTPRQLLAITAAQEIGKLPAGRIRPDMHRAAEARARKESFEAAATGDHATAYFKMQQALLNHELHTAALAAKKRVEAFRQHMVDLGKPAARARIGKAGGWEWTITDPQGKTLTVSSEAEARSAADQIPGATWERTSGYLDQIDGLRGQYEFAKISDKVLKRRQAMQDFVDAQYRTHGIPNAIPEDVMRRAGAGNVNWKTLTVDQLEALHDAVANIETMAKLKNTLLAKQREATLAETANRVNASVRDSNVTQVRAPRGHSTWDSLMTLKGRAVNAMTRATDVCFRLDGHQTGGVMFDEWERPLQDATAEKARRTADAVREGDQQIDRWGKSGPVANWSLHQGQYIAAVDRSFTKLEVIRMAADYGSDGNRQRLLENNKWTPEQAQAVFDTMDAADVRFLNEMTRYRQTFWSEKQALDQRTRGYANKKVEGLPFQTKGGLVEGGYMPVVYNTADHPELRVTETQAADNMLKAQGMGGTYTSSSSSKARTGNAGVPLSTDFADFGRHIAEVIHDLTLRETLIDANRLWKRITPTISERYGSQTAPVLRDQMMAVAAGGVRIVHPLEVPLGYLRQNVNLATRSFNIIGSLRQLAGIPFVAARTGYVPAIRALADAVNPVSLIYAHHASQVLPYRNAERGRMLTENFNRLSVAAALNPLRNFGYYFINSAWKVLDTHAWYAAYYEAQSRFPDDEAKCRDIADGQVAATQGATDTKDMSAIMRGGELAKVFTNMMSWDNANFNLMALSMLRYTDKGGTWNPASQPREAWKMAAAMGTLLVVAPSIYAIVNQGLTRDDLTQWGDPKKAAGMAASEAGFTVLSTVPGLRDIAPLLERSHARYEGPQGADALGAIAQAALELKGLASGAPSRSRAPVPPGVRAALDLTGALLPFPSAQVEHMLGGWIDAERRHTNPVVGAALGPAARPARAR